MALQKPLRQNPQAEPERQHDDPQAVLTASPPTSRLCVKNIPKYLTEQRLKDHFSSKGQVTDVKILKTRDGQPRQMAFVGYSAVDDAAAALKYFNNTFIDTSRVIIEYARRYRTAEPPVAPAAGTAAAADQAAAAAGGHRPWSKYSVGSSKHQQLLAKQQAAAAAQATDAAANKAAQTGKKEKKGSKAAADALQEPAAAADAKLAEFLQLMQPRAKAKIWSNDEILPGQAGRGATAMAVAAAAAAGAQGELEDDLYEDLPAPPAPTAPAQVRAAAASLASDGPDSQSDSEGTDPLAAKDAVVLDEGVSDLEYLRARMRQGPTAAAAANGAAAGSDDGSEASDDGSSSSGSEGSEGGFDEGAELEERRQRHGMASTSGSSSEEMESEDSGSDGDVLAWQQQQQQQPGSKQNKQQQQQQQMEGTSPPRSGSRSSSEEEEDKEMQEPGFEPGSEDVVEPMALDNTAQQLQPSAGAPASSDAAAVEASVRESGRLFVRNLAYTAGQLELSQLFGTYGDLEEVHLVLDRDTRRSKGIAYIKYLLPEDAVAAFRALDMTPFQGRLLHVLPALRKPGEEAAETKAQQQGPGGYKTDKEAQQKRDAGNRSAWSTLFMRSDTVAAAVAAHYGVSKAQLLDASAEDLPLRMALGEAQVIAQTKAALADAGVNTKALEAAAAVSGSAAAHKSVMRSSTSLLVKNLPYSADADELQQMFTGPGRSVVRLVLPPTKTLALVELGEPQDARAAFKALAYKKYQQVPLYLEWAPKDIWDTPPPAATKPAAAAGAAAAGPDGSTGAGAAANGGQAVTADVAGTAAEDDDAEQAPVISIYVKNLNFATKDASLKSHFDKAVSAAGGQVHSAKVARRKAADGKLLSMGYGFVETDSEAVAQAVIKQLQGSMLDKHKLTLQLSKRTSTGSSSKAAKKSKESDGKGTKLVVRNVAFEATKKDIMGLFGPFGHIKSCRLPKKFDGNHRGFAFLEFTTKQEAANALDGVGGTHLYGRRLVVEYAQADAEGLTATGEPSDLQQARARTAAKFLGAQGRSGDGVEAAAEAPARKRMKRNL